MAHSEYGRIVWCGAFHVQLNETKLLHILFFSQRLTAYVAKVFTIANNLIQVRSEPICKAIKYLILNGQQTDGSFKEVQVVSHGEMTVCVLISSTSVLILNENHYISLS